MTSLKASIHCRNLNHTLFYYVQCNCFHNLKSKVYSLYFVTESHLELMWPDCVCFLIMTACAEEPCGDEQEYERRLLMHVHALVCAWNRWSCSCHLAAG